MQRRLLHGADEKFPVRTEREPEVRALPWQQLRFALRVGKPQAHAVIVGDGKPQSLGSERQSAHRRRRFKRALSTPVAAGKGLFASRPGKPPLRAARDVIDPTSFCVLEFEDTLALDTGGNDLAVVASGKQPPGAGRR